MINKHQTFLFFCMLVGAIIFVQSARSSKVMANENCSLAALEQQGAKLATNDDGTLKSLDLTPIKNLVLAANADFSAADLTRMKSLRVVRGNGTMNRALLVAMAGAPRLTELLWTETNIPAKDFAVLKQHRGLKKLRLSGLKDTDQITAVLDVTATLPQLNELDISRSALTDELLKTADWSRGFPKIAKLNLYDVPVTDESIETLAPLAERLTWLNLDATKITNNGIRNISVFQKLTFLHLGRTIITNQAVPDIAKLKNLKTVHVTRTQMTEKGYEELKKLLPDCDVITQVQDAKK